MFFFNNSCFCNRQVKCVRCNCQDNHDHEDRNHNCCNCCCHKQVQRPVRPQCCRCRCCCMNNYGDNDMD